MKRLFLMIGALIVISSAAKSQQWVHSPNDQIQSLNWGIIDMVMFKKVKDTLTYAIYNDDIKRFENRHFKLSRIYGAHEGRYETNSISDLNTSY